MRKVIISIVIMAIIVASTIIVKNYYAKQLVKQGETNFINGNYKIATEYLNRAIKYNGNITRAYLLRGRVCSYQTLKKYYNNEELGPEDYTNCRKAIDDFSKCISFNSNDTNALISRGIRYQVIKEYEEAKNDFSRTINIDPKNKEAYFRRAYINEKLGKIDLAIEDYTKSIEFDTTQSGSAYNNRALLYESIGEYKKAIDDFNKSIDLSPKSPNAYENKSRILLKEGQYSEALKLKKIAARLGSKSAKEWLTDHNETW